MNKHKKVAFVHDWLVTYRGGEKVLESLLHLYPEAPIYTLFYEPGRLPKSIRERHIIFPKTLNYLKHFRKLLLPVLPAVVESFDLRDYDLVISTSSCVAKGVITNPNAKHVCYIHSPMRYIWDQREHYMKGFSKIPFGRALFHMISSRLRLWDTLSSHRVDTFVANSSFVKSRVKKYYNRDAIVICPPVKAAPTQIPEKTSLTEKPYYLLAGAFVSYKRFDIAIEACEQLGKRLIVAGSGPAEDSLRAIGGKHTEFVISPDDEVWDSLMIHAEAFLFPVLEDFGITAIEALGCGTPIIAFKGGGALDFVEPGVNGCFFDEQSSESLKECLQNFEPRAFDRARLSEMADAYSETRFIKRMKSEIFDKMEADFAH